MSLPCTFSPFIHSFPLMSSLSALLPKLSKIDGTSVSDMQASMFLIVAGRLFAPPWSLSVHDVEDGEAMQVAAEKIGDF